MVLMWAMIHVIESGRGSSGSKEKGSRRNDGTLSTLSHGPV